MMMSPPTHCYLECFGANVYRQNFVVRCHIKVAIYSLSYCLCLSSLS
jgi:hypothetical protein